VTGVVAAACFSDAGETRMVKLSLDEVTVEGLRKLAGADIKNDWQRTIVYKIIKENTIQSPHTIEFEELENE
jgi:hypothetical protein